MSSIPWEGAMGGEGDVFVSQDEVTDHCSVCARPALHRCQRCGIPLCEVDLEHPLRMRWDKSPPIGWVGFSVKRSITEGEWDVCKACAQRIKVEYAPQIAKDTKCNAGAPFGAWWLSPSQSLPLGLNSRTTSYR
jgi:hypothetical protein